MKEWNCLFKMAEPWKYIPTDLWSLLTALATLSVGFMHPMHGIKFRLVAEGIQNEQRDDCISLKTSF